MWLTPESGMNSWRIPCDKSFWENFREWVAKTLSSAKPWIINKGLVNLSALLIKEKSSYFLLSIFGLPKYLSE